MWYDGAGDRGVGSTGSPALEWDIGLLCIIGAERVDKFVCDDMVFMGSVLIDIGDKGDLGDEMG